MAPAAKGYTTGRPASQHTEAVRDMREILRLVPRLRKRMSEWTPSEDTMGATSYPNAPASCSYTQVHERHDRRVADRLLALTRAAALRGLPASVDTGRTSHNAHISHTSAHVTTGKLHIATLLLDPGRRSMTTAHCLPDAAVEAPHEPASPANNEMIMSVR